MSRKPLKDGGESGTQISLLRKASNFPISLENLQPNSKCSRSLKAKSPPAICDFLIFTGKTKSLIKGVSTAISGRHFRSRTSLVEVEITARAGGEKKLTFHPAPSLPASTLRGRFPDHQRLTAQTHSVPGSSFPSITLPRTADRHAPMSRPCRPCDS